MPTIFIDRHFWSPARSLAAAQEIARFASAGLELLIFGPASIILPPILRLLSRRLVRSRLARVRQLFDAEFYLWQLPLRNRRRAARAADLHYVLIGRLKRLAPHPSFDPMFYNRIDPGCDRLRIDPLFRFLDEGRSSGLAGNECEDLRRALKTDTPASAPAVLVFNHCRGGGSSRFLFDMQADFVAKGVRVIQARPISKSGSLVALEDLTSREEARVFDLLTQTKSLSEHARMLGVKRLLVNHVIDWSADFDTCIPQIARNLDCPYDVVLHDYFSVCPRVNLIDARGRYCGIGAVEQCARCLRAGGSDAASASYKTWRPRWRAFLAGASRVIAPSEDLARRLAPHIGRVAEAFPPEPDIYPPPRIPHLQREQALKILVLGSLSVPKGLWLLSSLGRELRRMKAPVTITVLGAVTQPRLLRRAGIALRGSYLPHELDALIEAEAPHAIFLPSIWPETWSFVLSEALSRSLPVMAFDIGAPADRLRRLKLGELLPLEWANDSRALASHFLRRRNAWLCP